MDVKFGREYNFIIGRPQQLTKFIIPSTLVNPRIIDEGPPQTTSSGDVIDWNHVPAEWYNLDSEDGGGLQFTAVINQTKDSGVPCTITFTNAREEEVNRIRKDDLVILRAGYHQPSGNYIQALNVGEGQEQWPDLFVGQVDTVVTEWQSNNVDRITKITCSEGSTVRRNSKFSVSYVPGITRLTVLNDLLKKLKTQGVPTGSVRLPEEGTKERAKLDKPYLTGYALKGFILDEFEKYCESLSLRAFTVVGKIYVEPKTSTPANFLGASPAQITTQLPPSIEVFNITPDTVVGRVQPMSDSVNKPSNDSGAKDQQGVKFRVFLQGQITVAKFVELEDFEEDYDGLYEVTSVTHELDYRSTSKWYTNITATRV